MKELAILTSEKDLTTHQLSEMGDFFSIYLKQLQENSEWDEFPIAITPESFEIISEMLDYGTEILTKNSVHYVPNFDGLSKDIQDGIRSKKYVLGESVQVAGDMRATLIDAKSKVRVKDITLKEIRYSPNSLEDLQNSLVQIQLKKINEKLDAIYDMIGFQIRRDRDRDFAERFFKARDYIRDAQVTASESDREKYLYSAMDGLKSVMEAGYQEINTCAKTVSELTKRSVFKKEKQIREYLVYMCEDICIINKCVGLQMQIYDYQGKINEKNEMLKSFIKGMQNLAEENIGNTGETAIGVLQDNYPYNNRNKNAWYNYINSISELKNVSNLLETNAKTYLIGAED